MTRALLERYDNQIRRGIAPQPGYRIERARGIVRIIGAWNCVLHADLDENTVAPEIARQLEHARMQEQPLQWKVYGHDRPRTLPDHLQAAGFVLAETETLMVLDLARYSPDPTMPRGIVVRRLANAAELEHVATVGEAAFGNGYLDLMAEFHERLPLGTLTFYIAYDGAEAVASARLELPQDADFAGLYGGGTVPAYRHRGIYRSLVAARAREARDRGYRYLTVEAAATSKPILERLGFAPISVVSTWYWEPS